MTGAWGSGATANGGADEEGGGEAGGAGALDGNGSVADVKDFFRGDVQPRAGESTRGAYCGEFRRRSCNLHRTSG